MPRQLSLRELQPPGEGYDEWYHVRPGMDPALLDDPRVTVEALAVLNRLAWLGPVYDYEVPHAAVLLDTVIDTGKLAVLEGPLSHDRARVVPIEDFAAVRPELGLDGIRESIHQLHATGMLLIVCDDQYGTTYVRFVAKKPEQPGDSWGFVGDPDLVVATVCMPSEIWDVLPADVAAAVLVLRGAKVSLEDADPVSYGKSQGVNGTQHARDLFAAARASGYVDYKGCEACPAGHLCTLPERSGGPAPS